MERHGGTRGSVEFPPLPTHTRAAPSQQAAAPIAKRGLISPSAAARSPTPVPWASLAGFHQRACPDGWTDGEGSRHSDRSTAKSGPCHSTPDGASKGFGEADGRFGARGGGSAFCQCAAFFVGSVSCGRGPIGSGDPRPPIVRFPVSLLRSADSSCLVENVSSAGVGRGGPRL